MEKNAPENVFGIADQKNISLPSKGMSVESSDEKPKEDLIMETKDMTLDDLKSYLQKNNVTVNEENIQNYYNQIIENKKYVNEYNQTIKELEDVKKDFTSKNEEKGDIQNPDRTIVSKLSEIEKRLADINVEKQKREDDIKSTINNIFNKNKTENSKSVNFETKNNILNMALKGVEKPVISEKKEEKGIENESEEEKEKEFLETPVKKENVEEKEFLETPVKKENVEEKEFSETPVKKENVEEKEFLETIKKEGKSDGILKEEPIEESTKKNPISNVEKIENSPNSVKSEEKREESDNKDFTSLSEEMKKGFESVLNAIQGINKGGPESKKEEQPKESKEPVKETPIQQPSPQSQNNPKTPQTNFIDVYRESLRSNAPLKGYVGIKGLELKANNIGSYV